MVTQAVHRHSKSPASLGHVQFELLVHWTSHPSKIFATQSTPASFRVLGLLSATCFRPFWFPLKSPTHLFYLNPLQLLFLIINPIHTQGWTSRSLGNWIQHATWPKWPREGHQACLKPLHRFPIQYRVKSGPLTIAFTWLWTIMHQKKTYM